MIWLNRLEPLVQYSMAHNKRLPAQEQFRTDLIEVQRVVGGSLVSFVGRRVIGLNQLSLSECSALGEAAVDRALRDAQHDIEIGLLSIHEYAQPQPADFMQSCFGVPGIITSACETCQHCPHLSKCDLLRDHIIRTTEATTGSPDPIREEQKRKNREGVGRSRRKKKGHPQGASPALAAEES